MRARPLLVARGAELDDVAGRAALAVGRGLGAVIELAPRDAVIRGLHRLVALVARLRAGCPTSGCGRSRSARRRARRPRRDRGGTRACGRAGARSRGRWLRGAIDVSVLGARGVAGLARAHPHARSACGRCRRGSRRSSRPAAARVARSRSRAASGAWHCSHADRLARRSVWWRS